MELSLRYVTRFVYSRPVWESHNAVRACPAEDGGQHLLSYQLTVSPAASVFSYQDNWGTRVDAFGIRDSHRELMVTASARVETAPAPTPETAPMEALSEPAYADLAWNFRRGTRHTHWRDKLAHAAGEAVAGTSDVVEAVTSIERLVHDSMDYRAGATSVGVDVEHVWETGAGVCQDFAHLTIAMLRSVGIAARYVSGYFYASDPTAVEGAQQGEIVVATHAWVEAAIPGWGWWAIDPTNAGPVGESHVKIGHGRDYDDVTPLRGVYFGDSEHHLAAAVTMSTRPIVGRTLPEVDDAVLQEMAQQQQQ